MSCFDIFKTFFSEIIQVSIFNKADHVSQIILVNYLFLALHFFLSKQGKANVPRNILNQLLLEDGS